MALHLQLPPSCTHPHQSPGHAEIDFLNAWYADRSAEPWGDQQMAITYVDGSGKTRVKGGRDLKQSQSYPQKLLDSKDVFSFLFLYHLFLYEINTLFEISHELGGFTRLHVRQGTAMAKLRTKFLKSHKLKAKRFLRQAAKNTTKLNTMCHINKMFIDGANLEPVLSFLSK